MTKPSIRLARAFSLAAIGLIWTLALAAPVGGWRWGVGGQKGTDSQISKGSIAVVFSGELNGYLTPCGCSSPMMGGLTRRANYLKLLNPETAVVRVENGDLTPSQGRQDELKADTVIDALNLMKYDAVNLGEQDFAMGMERLRSLQSRLKAKMLCANAVDASGKALFDGQLALIRENDGKKVPITIVGVLSNGFAQAVHTSCPEVTLEPAEAAITRLLSKLPTAGARILLFHGPQAEAEALAAKFPKFQLVVSAHVADDPTTPKKTSSCTIAAPGTDGKHLSLALLSGSGWKVSEVRVRDLSPELGENAEIQAALALYGERVGSEGLLGQVPKSPSSNGDTFAGTASCVTCHASAAKVWQSSKHAHAMATLEKEKHDKDPECVGCHVVGLTVEGGFVGHNETPHLENVGCESCHGPAAKHVADPSVKLEGAGEAACAQCHVPLNSPRFDFASYWAKVKHGK